MQKIVRTFVIGVTASLCVAMGQTKPSFEVATIKPAQPLDPAKIVAALQQGNKLPVGVNIDGNRAEYKYLDLKNLIVYAYGVKPYQIVGPDWMATTRFDITAKMPDGSKKDDSQQMLQSLLEERFKLAVHRASGERAVMALVTTKGGLKLKPSTDKPVAIDENAPLGPGEVKTEGPDGPMRVKVDLTTGSSVIDMGLKGKMAYKVNPATQSLDIDFKMTTMSGLADMMTQLMTQIGGAAAAAGAKQIVDQTGVSGNYDAALKLSLQDLIAMIRAAGADIPGLPPAGGGGPGAGAGNLPTAADPGGAGSSVTEGLSAMGLKLEAKKATVDQLVVDHIEKAPTEN